ncbi:glutaminase, partial [Escherichia coli]|uniref:DoxX family protein n=1 Tax=Escherichia coli TaxID=562 RepID=UPI003D327CC5
MAIVTCDGNIYRAGDSDYRFALESISKVCTLALALEDVGVLVARILMPILFITAGWGKITGYAGTQQYMEAMGVPGFMLPL